MMKCGLVLLLSYPNKIEHVTYVESLMDLQAASSRVTLVATLESANKRLLTGMREFVGL